VAAACVVAAAFVAKHTGADSRVRENAGNSPAKAEFRNSPQSGIRNKHWFHEAKFGLFIHWNPCSATGKEISSIPNYDGTYRTFRPHQFDAEHWVTVARNAGMKYLVFTTKHHDGFCMFDTKLTDFKITQQGFDRDVTAELARACHAAGMRLGFYYSPVDLHHPNFTEHPQDDPEGYAVYLEYYRKQLVELCTNYGPVDILWFDGLDASADQYDTETVFPMLRKLQPHILFNDRAGLPGDFNTVEQKVGQSDDGRYWESCVTLGTQWSWQPEDDLKSWEECVRLLVRCAGGGGNLLLNVGPMPTGRIEPRQVEILSNVGKWLSNYGESIYGTRGGPFPSQWWGESTHRDNTIYLHILECRGDTLVLPPIEATITDCQALTGGEATFRQTEQGIEISVSEEHRRKLDTIIALKLDRTAPSESPRE